MTDKTYIVEGRQFRTEADYRRAVRDRETIQKLRSRAQGGGLDGLKQLKSELNSGKYQFYTLLEQDFKDEIDELIQEMQKSPGNRSRKAGKFAKSGKPGENTGKYKTATIKKRKEKSTDSGGQTDAIVESYVQEVLKQRERRRKFILLLCSILAAGCLGYFGVYSYYIYRTNATYRQLSELKEKGRADADQSVQDLQPVIHYDNNTVEIPEVLEEYKNLLKKNQKLIGWVKIDDTKIDYPVMQTVDNEYYLDHNLNQEYDKNGSIFMDKDCDVLKPSTNFIIYGHHMKSGQMFGNLDKYESEKYGKEHPYIDFDTIYEHGIYKVMYVFRSRVFSEEEITFKYYQFIDAVSEKEFDSNMQEMAAMSLYDTGVTAEYGDHLLTLSTCDYQEKNGRFVVVAKKVAAKEY